MYTEGLTKILAICNSSRAPALGNRSNGLPTEDANIAKMNYFPISTLFRPKIPGYFYISQLIRMLVSCNLTLGHFVTPARSSSYGGYIAVWERTIVMLVLHVKEHVMLVICN